MDNQSREKKRAANIVWNASGDYSFQPDFETYDGQGRADLYWNYIAGAVRKYYDYPRLQRFFNSLTADPNHVFYESLAWIGLENCAYEKGRRDRPALEDLRRSCAGRVVRGEEPPSFYFLVDEVRRAHFQRVLGEEPAASEKVLLVLDDLEFPPSLDAEGIVQRLMEIIHTHFPMSLAARKRKLFPWLHPANRKLYSVEYQANHWHNPFSDSPLFSLFHPRSAEFSGGNTYREEEAQRKPKQAWQDLQDRWLQKQREFIEHYYGESILPAPDTKGLEHVLCVENHRSCHLHFTRGAYSANALTKTRANEPVQAALNQREINTAYYQAGIARNSTAIEKLTGVIRNTMLLTLEASPHRAKAGRLAAGKVWRNVYLNDEKVFVKNIAGEIGSLTVDILLDASGSQLDRQEVIAAQGYIIAESLTRCRIPVRMYSFCTNKAFTVFQLFRDYDEVDQNEQVFHYHASGCNRDGLAVRTALHLMARTPAELKILIVLTDGKPLDPQGFPASGFDPDRYMYAGAPGVSDTAAEVRKGWRSGAVVLCVFTGAEADIPAAKQMYGSSLVCIETPDRFAGMVGLLIRNVFSFQ